MKQSERSARQLEKMRSSLRRYENMLRDWTRWGSPEEAEADGCIQQVEDPETGELRTRTHKEFEEEKRFMLSVFLPAQIRRRRAEIKRKFGDVTLSEKDI